MDDLDNHVLEYIIQITDRHREGPWSGLSDDKKNEVLQKWQRFSLNRQIGGIDYEFSIDQLNQVDDIGVIGRVIAAELTLLQTHDGKRRQLDRAYLYLVGENEQQAQMDNQDADNQDAEGDDMDIEGDDMDIEGDDMDIEGEEGEIYNMDGVAGSKTKKRKSKRRKSKKRKSKKRKSKSRKTHKRKSKKKRRNKTKRR